MSAISRLGIADAAAANAVLETTYLLEHNTRVTQDSPVLPDVWMKYDEVKGPRRVAGIPTRQHGSVAGGSRRVRERGITYTVKNGIVYDAKRLLADVAAMVERQKKERQTTGAR